MSAQLQALARRVQYAVPVEAVAGVGGPYSEALIGKGIVSGGVNWHSVFACGRHLRVDFCACGLENDTNVGVGGEMVWRRTRVDDLPIWLSAPGLVAG